jgi:aminobenzoyl-glutamate utilization protein B
LYVGGQSLTYLPEYTQLWYGFSAPTLGELERIRDILVNGAEAACKVTGCSYGMRVTGFSRSTLPNRHLQKLAYRNLELVGPPQFSEEEKEFCRELQKSLGMEPMDEPLDEALTPPWELPVRPAYMTGSDDSNEFSWYAPFAWIRVTTRIRTPTTREYFGKSQASPWAEGALSSTGVGHKCLVVTAKALGLSIVELLTTPSEVDKAKAEFRERVQARGGRERSLIPEGVKPPVDLALPEFDGKETIVRYPTTGKAPIHFRENPRNVDSQKD